MHIKFIVMYIQKFMHDATCCAGESWGLLEASGPLAVQGLRCNRGLRPFWAKAGAWACRGTGNVWLPWPMAVCGGVEKRFTVSRNSAMRVAQMNFRNCQYTVPKIFCTNCQHSFQNRLRIFMQNFDSMAHAVFSAFPWNFFLLLGWLNR